MALVHRQFSRKSVIVGLLVSAAAILALVAGHRRLAVGVDHVIEACRTAGPWVYFSAMAILPLMGFSLFAFVASAGLLFAPTLGVAPVIACGLAALAVNVSLSYLLARGALRPAVLRIVRRFGYALPDVCRYGAWEIALLARLLPGPPFGLQSCLLGIARVPFGIYFVTSVAVPGLYFSGMVCLGGGAATHSAWLAAIAGAGLGIVCLAVHRLRSRLTRPWNDSTAGLTEAG